VEISIACPDDTHGIRAVQYRSWLANTANEGSGRSFAGPNKMRSVSSRHGNSELKYDVHCSRNNSLPGSKTIVARVNQKVIGFCTVVRGSEQNNLAEIYIIPAFRGKKIGRRLWDSARQFIDQNNDTTVALLRLNTPAKRFYESLGFAETGVFWEGENSKKGDGATVIEMILRA
jgi:ribosomal protein S18 acetylase RimI-like enzyme